MTREHVEHGGAGPRGPYLGALRDKVGRSQQPTTLWSDFDNRGFVPSDGVFLVAEICRRLRWKEKGLRAAREAGLRIIRFGRASFVTGAELLRFFESLQAPEKEAGDHWRATADAPPMTDTGEDIDPWKARP